MEFDLVEDSGNSIVFQKDGDMSRLMQEEPSYCHDSLREDFKELGIAATSQPEFYKICGRILDDKRPIGLDSRQQLYYLWEMSVTMKSSSKLHHTRETIAIHYGRLLNETNQLNELCRFLKLNIPILESEQQKLKIRFSQLHILYFLLVKAQIVLRQFPQANKNLNRIQQIISLQIEEKKKQLTLKFLFLKSKYYEAQGNKLEQYTQLQKAIEYIRTHRIQSNFATKVNLLFHKLHTKSFQQLQKVQKVQKVQKLSRKKIPFNKTIDKIATMVTLKSPTKKPDWRVANQPSPLNLTHTNLTTIAKANDHRILKSLHNNQRSRPYSALKPKPSPKQHQLSYMPQDISMYLGDFKLKMLDSPANLCQKILKRPEYARYQSLHCKMEPQQQSLKSQRASVGVATPQHRKNPLNQEQQQANRILNQQQELQLNIELDESFVMDRNSSELIRSSNEKATNYVFQQEQEQYSMKDEACSPIHCELLGHDEPRRSLLDEFIVLDEPYSFQYIHGYFYCNSTLLKIIRSELIFVEGGIITNGLTINLRVFLMKQEHLIVVTHSWATQRFLNCKARLLDFLLKIYSPNIDLTSTYHENYDQDIQHVLFQVINKYLIPTTFSSKYRFNFEMEQRRSLNYGDELKNLVVRQGAEFYRNTSTLERIRKTTSQFIQEKTVNTLVSCRFSHEDRSSVILAIESDIQELQVKSEESNFNKRSHSIMRCQDKQFENVLSTVQQSDFWRTRNSSNRPCGLPILKNSGQAPEVRQSFFSSTRNSWSIVKPRVSKRSKFVHSDIKKSCITQDQPSKIETADQNISIVHSACPTRLFQTIKSCLISDSKTANSNDFLQRYFDKSCLDYQCSIKNLGACMITLTVYSSKPIYCMYQQFFKLDVVPNKSKTNFMKFVATNRDVEMLLNRLVPHSLNIEGLHHIISVLWSLIRYEKESLYSNISFDVVEKQDNYSYYNRFIEEGTFEQEVDQSKEPSFLSRKLRNVRYVIQKTIKIQLSGRVTYIILSIQKFSKHRTFTVFMYSPISNRNLSFELNQSTLQKMTDEEIQFIFNLNPADILTSHKKSLLFDRFFLDSTDPQTLKAWDRFVSMLRFGVLQFQDKKCFHTQLAGELIFANQTNFGELSEICGYLLKIEFRLARKKPTHSDMLNDPFENVTLAEIQRFNIYLQLTFVAENCQINLLFSFEDFIHVVMNLPQRNNYHTQLECVIFNMADIGFLFDTCRKDIFRCLENALSSSRPQDICCSIANLSLMHKRIEQEIENVYAKICLLRKTEKISLNCYKNRQKNNYLKVLFKGILRFRTKSICGLFYDKQSKTIIARIEERESKQIRIPLQQINLPFVPEVCKPNILKSSDRRIFKGLRNRLLFSQTSAS